MSLGNLATFTETKTPENAVIRKFLDAGANPPKAVIVTYYLKKKPTEKISLAFLDAQGNLIKEFFSKPEEPKDEVVREYPLR